MTIRGILDTRGTTPELYPRTADEITIIEHPELKTPTLQHTQNPLTNGWTPVGVAAGAIVATEGAKRFHRWVRLKRLEQKLKNMECVLTEK